MCIDCEILEKVFEVAPNNAHSNYIPALRLIKELVKQERLVLYLGDCEIDDTEEILYSEKHFTVCHYLKCKKCYKVFFIGACIRGVPKFDVYEKYSNSEMKRMIWGNCGVLKK